MPEEDKIVAKTPLEVPSSTLPRVVIVGAGFGGLKAAQKLKNKAFQVVLLDINNYHQFQPLFYQVAMSGLEPSSIVFPLRKIFHKTKNIHVRTAKALEIDRKDQILYTDNGYLHYDYLLLAMGAETNFFGNKSIEKHALGMKSVSESLYLRNRVLEMLENASNLGKSMGSTDIVVIGGGPTGVELSGSLAEMKKMVFPHDYPEIDFNSMKIWLIEGSGKLISGMDPKSSQRALQYLEKLGVHVKLNCRTDKIERDKLYLTDGSTIAHGLIIWAAGVKAFGIKGLAEDAFAANGRIKTNPYLLVKSCENIYCIGDQAEVEDSAWEKGHPQVAQPAIQQGALFAKNLLAMQKNKTLTTFRYKDLGNMATVGRNLAVAEIAGLKLGGFLAWIIWMAVHLMAIVGIKNRLFIFINWLWSYITYDQSLRLLIKPFKRKEL